MKMNAKNKNSLIFSSSSSCLLEGESFSLLIEINKKKMLGRNLRCDGKEEEKSGLVQQMCWVVVVSLVRYRMKIRKLNPIERLMYRIRMSYSLSPYSVQTQSFLVCFVKRCRWTTTIRWMFFWGIQGMKARLT